ncbi:MAG: hypothetical protein OXP69_15335 [Spirochaetaceae bacterium]|nr:hypothetical protein [Spirochaetaceae bacterium]
MAASSERCGTGRRSGYAEVKPLTDCLLARLGADERVADSFVEVELELRAAARQEQAGGTG